MALRSRCAGVNDTTTIGNRQAWSSRSRCSATTSARCVRRLVGGATPGPSRCARRLAASAWGFSTLLVHDPYRSLRPRVCAYALNARSRAPAAAEDRQWRLQPSWPNSPLNWPRRSAVAVTVEVGDSDIPPIRVAGGSNTTAKLLLVRHEPVNAIRTAPRSLAVTARWALDRLSAGEIASIT